MATASTEPRQRTRWLRHGFLLLILGLTLALGILLNPQLLTGGALAAVAVNGVEVGLMALGELLVIVGGDGGIDLSVGSMFALSEVILGVLVAHGLNVWLATAATLLAGILLGAVNGLGVTRLGIPAIITTLGTMYAYSGAALLLTHGVDISPFPASFGVLGQGTVAGIPVQLLFIYLPTVVVLGYGLTRTTFGWELYFVGTNARAAALAGLNPRRTRWWSYVLTGFLSALAGIIDASRLVTARPDAGAHANLAAITIAVLGGADLAGGRGDVSGTVLATAIITVLSYSFSLANVNSVLETGAVGVVLLVAIAGQRLRRRRHVRSPAPPTPAEG